MAKGPEAFRTISEASLELGVAQHVLRFWETRFSFIRPLKRAGGRRFYRPRAIAILATVRHLLHEAGYTIKGVQKLHREQGVNHLAAAGPGNGHAWVTVSPRRSPTWRRGGPGEVTRSRPPSTATMWSVCGPR